MSSLSSCKGSVRRCESRLGSGCKCATGGAPPGLCCAVLRARAACGGSRERGVPRRPQTLCEGHAYWRSFRTCCGSELACASTEIPACCSTCALLRLAVSAAKLASMICDCAALMLVDCVCTFEIAAVNVFCVAPSVAWKLYTFVSAASIAVMAACGPAVVELLMPLTPRPFASHVVLTKFAVFVVFALAPTWMYIEATSP